MRTLHVPIILAASIAFVKTAIRVMVHLVQIETSAQTEPTLVIHTQLVTIDTFTAMV